MSQALKSVSAFVGRTQVGGGHTGGGGERRKQQLLKTAGLPTSPLRAHAFPGGPAAFRGTSGYALLPTLPRTGGRLSSNSHWGRNSRQEGHRSARTTLLPADMRAQFCGSSRPCVGGRPGEDSHALRGPCTVARRKRCQEPLVSPVTGGQDDAAAQSSGPPALSSRQHLGQSPTPWPGCWWGTAGSIREVKHCGKKNPSLQRRTPAWSLRDGWAAGPGQKVQVPGGTVVRQGCYSPGNLLSCYSISLSFCLACLA